ncbi:MAG: helix-turn-helix transcriptional regulator [Sedimentisphaerales bacterium]
MTTKKKQDDYRDFKENASSVWEFESEEQKKEMLESITQPNCGKKLKLVRDLSGLSRRELATVIGVSESTVFRIETKKTLPTKDFMLRLGGLVAIGHARYSKMSENEKETVSEYIGAGGGVAAGIGGAIGAISASGSVAGLSAAGITSGLAALGGGTMLGGIIVVGAIPLAFGAAGYGLVKGIKAICEANKLSCKEIDGQFEISRESIRSQMIKKGRKSSLKTDVVKIKN